MLRSSAPAVRRTAISHLASPPRAEGALLLLAHLDREADVELRAHTILSLKRATPPALAARVAARLAAAFAATTSVRERATILAAFKLYPALEDRAHYAAIAQASRPGEEAQKAAQLARTAPAANSVSSAPGAHR